LTTRVPPTRWLAAVGVPLVLLGQTLTLVHLRPLSDYWYGVVWTGFVCVADAVLTQRHGQSLIVARPRELVTMALASAVLWWGCELVNGVLLGNWAYTPSPDVPLWAQRVRSTYFFATLLPATFFASALGLSVARPRRAPPLAASSGSPPVSLVRWVSAVTLPCAAAASAIAVLRRDLSLPCLLIAAGLFLDTVNLWRRRPSLGALVATGQWRLVTAIGLGNIAAGIVGEAWNFPADPRWAYETSYAGTVRLFAMPLPGYLGYAALAFDLFAAYHFVRPRALDTSSNAGTSLGGAHPFHELGVGGLGKEY
jgi:hypothetical protein